MTKPLSPPTPLPSTHPNQRYRDEKALLIKSSPSGRWELNDCSNVPNLRQICWQTGHLDWAGPAGNSCIWKLFSWQKLRDAPRTDIPPAVTNLECKWVCVCVRNTWVFFRSSYFPAHVWCLSSVHRSVLKKKLNCMSLILPLRRYDHCVTTSRVAETLLRVVSRCSAQFYCFS